VIISDWRAASADDVQRLYAAETARWRRDLGWDISTQWPVVESARAAGTLPGWIARSPAGEVRGWSFHLLHRDTLQVGALASDAPETTRQLLAAIRSSPEAGSAGDLLIFGYHQAPGLAACLEPLGYQVQSYRYLEKSLDTPVAPAAPALRSFERADAPGIAALLAAAYPAVDPVRPFARTGHRDDWVEYVAQLIFGRGCGDFEPSLSPVSPGEEGSLAGAALVTRIAPGVAHLAQVAVHPVVRGRRVGRSLIDAAAAAARRQGCARLTLLVSDCNEPARQLYGRLGFVETAAFASVGGEVR